MTRDIPSPEDVRQQRAERLAALVQAMTEAHQSLRATMAPDEFHRMMVRMAEQQLIYEEFGHEPR
jgi:predicted regulator of Ras-like GTPase activity (Roadblock/LC7/MglB family)